MLDPVHPGEVLSEEFLLPLNISPQQLAVHLGVPVLQVTNILSGTTAVSPEMALRLSRFFGSSERFWLNLQTTFDLARARVLLAAPLENITPFHCE